MMRIAGHKLSSSTQYSKDKLIYNFDKLRCSKESDQRLRYQISLIHQSFKQTYKT